MAAQEMRMRYGDVGDSNFAVHGSSVPLLVGLLCALVFFVALCLYLRWRCGRYRPDDPEASSSAAAAPLPGLDADAIRALPVKLYRAPPRLAGKDGVEAEADDREALCSICIGALEAGEKVKVLPPCGHFFHPECVDLWLQSHPSCPLCRHLLVAAAAKPDVNGTDEAV
jgi:hypothetical protein